MFYNAFPVDLKENLNRVIKILPHSTFSNVPFVTCGRTFEYVIGNNVVAIPYRIYLLDISDEEYEKLNQIQKQILCCIYTRSCDGKIREKYLRKLLDMPFEQWSVPYVIKLCDEYVIELLEIIYDKLKERDNRDFQEFCMKNKSSVNKSYSRMISYWNVYYRRQEYNFEKYIGRKIFTECFGYDKRFKR